MLLGEFQGFKIYIDQTLPFNLVFHVRNKRIIISASIIEKDAIELIGLVLNKS